MATSLQFSSDHHPIPQENHQTTNQTSTGGRRRSSKNGQKKKKQPQRGMGVEQLERLRVQDQMKNSTIHGVHHNHQYYSNNNFPKLTPVSSFTGGGSASADPGNYSNSILNSSPVLQFPKLCAVSPNDFFMQQKVVNTGFIGSSSTNQLMISSHDHHQFQSQMNLYGFATSKPSTEKSKELYPMPNLFSSNNSCFSDRCRSCNKKKRMINGEEISVHMEDMIREKEDSGTKPLLHSYSLPSHQQKGVEIVAIHRKGSSSALSSDEGAVMMEYDFFPEKISSKSTNTYKSCFENEATMMSAYNSPESSSFAAAAAAAGNIINGEASSVTTISWAADTTTTSPTSSIDLSLKLSC
ncbi:SPOROCYTELESS/NOOZLE-like protein [Solanum lycopersicum]|nr:SPOROCYTELESS/NOOZLE-like protein [Solanum lycopersicum]APD76161.1 SPOROCYTELESS/NOOZLE-like protein [Solanum lycopersicum]